MVNNKSHLSTKSPHQGSQSAKPNPQEAKKTKPASQGAAAAGKGADKKKCERNNLWGNCSGDVVNLNEEFHPQVLLKTVE